MRNKPDQRAFPVVDSMLRRLGALRRWDHVVTGSVNRRAALSADAPTTEERDLIRRCRAGDDTAFQPLMDPYTGSLWAFLYGYAGDGAACEDLLQETLIRVWRALPAYQERGRFEGWLYQIARNVARDEGRRQSRRPKVEYLNVVPELTVRAGPADELEAQELADALSAAVAGLPEKQRQVFLLRLHADVSFRDIAESMGEPLNTVLGHMHKAMTTLRGVIALVNDV